MFFRILANLVLCQQQVHRQGILSCIGHNSVVSKIIKDTKRDPGDSAVLWLDLTNASGSVAHKLVNYTLEACCVSQKVQLFFQNYFRHFKMCFTTSTPTGRGWRSESLLGTPSLFGAAMNQLITSVQKQRWPTVLWGCPRLAELSTGG